ncbi:hypothetical protein D3C84_767960 [compost metagenome]
MIDDDPYIARDLAQYAQIRLGFLRVNVQMLVREQAGIKCRPLPITEPRIRNRFRSRIMQDDSSANHLRVRETLLSGISRLCLDRAHQFDTAIALRVYGLEFVEFLKGSEHVF